MNDLLNKIEALWWGIRGFFESLPGPAQIMILAAFVLFLLVVLYATFERYVD